MYRTHGKNRPEEKRHRIFFFPTKLPCDSFLDFKQHDEPPLPAAHSNMASNLWLQGPQQCGGKKHPLQKLKASSAAAAVAQLTNASRLTPPSLWDRLGTRAELSGKELALSKKP